MRQTATTHARHPGPPKLRALGGQSGRAFTLIELLVVVSIITLLIALLLPGLSKARARAKLTVCRAQLSQVGLAVLSYADENRELIPRGPACEGPYDFFCADYATNQIWIGAEAPSHPRTRTGLGTLIPGAQATKRLFYCPADDSSDLEEELPRVGTDLDAYCSYTYRQLDMLPEERDLGRLSNLGSNQVGEVLVPVEALAFDANSLGAEPYHRTNHNGAQVNVLYRDRSVLTFTNEEDIFSVRAQDFDPFFMVFLRMDQILVNADYGYRHAPKHAPEIELGP